MFNTVKTKSGAKIHRGYNGSTITLCGIRYAMIVKVRPGIQAEHFCSSCGMSPVGVELAESLCKAFAFAAVR